jgi:putative phosphoribosyl transferase
MVFKDRFEAGRMLAGRLSKYKGEKQVIVLAIPRGGVEVGYVIARKLKAKLDVVISKKIPYPGQPELAIGAICNDVVSLDKPLIGAHKISSSYVKAEIGKLEATVKNRYKELTGKSVFPELKGRIVIITVGPPENLELLKGKVDDMVVIEKPIFFMAVGEFYGDFKQLSDEDAAGYLRKAKEWC